MHHGNNKLDIIQKCRRVFSGLTRLRDLYSKIFPESPPKSVENLIYSDFQEILSYLIEARMKKDTQLAQSAMEEFFKSVDDEKLLKWRSESQNPVFINSARYLLNLIFENQQNIDLFLSKPSSKPSVSARVEKLFTLCCLSNHKNGLKQLVTLARKKAEDEKVEIFRTCFYTLAQYPKVFEDLLFELAADFFELPLSAWKNLKTATFLYLYIYSSSSDERVNFLKTLRRWLGSQLFLVQMHEEDPLKVFNISKVIEEVHSHIVANLPDNSRDVEIIL